MAIEKIPITVTAMQNLLNSGYTWFKKDDLGFGSVQEKFEASDVQIATIRKHPLLKDLETTARVFVIIDDTKDAVKTITPVSATGRVHEDNLGSLPGLKSQNAVNGSGLLGDSKPNDEKAFVGTDLDNDSFSAFANL